MKGRTVRQLLVTLCGIVMLGIGFSTAAAQPATPAPDFPDPAECQGAPRPGAMLRGTPTGDIDVLGTMVAATPMTIFQVPSGKPADAATVAALDATLRGLIACVNAVDRERIYSYFSDTFPATGLYILGIYNLYAFDAPATPLPPGERLQLATVADARLLTDGRVGVLISTPLDERGLFLFFVPSNDPGRPAWLIDGAIAVEGQ